MLEVTFNPIGDKVIIEPVLNSQLAAQDLKKRTGLILASPKHQGIPIIGDVVAIGPDVDRCKVGDRVMFKEQSPRGFKWEGKGYIPTTNNHILALVTEDD